MFDINGHALRKTRTDAAYLIGTYDTPFPESILPIHRAKARFLSIIRVVLPTVNFDTKCPSNHTNIMSLAVFRQNFLLNKFIPVVLWKCAVIGKLSLKFLLQFPLNGSYGVLITSASHLDRKSFPSGCSAIHIPSNSSFRAISFSLLKIANGTCAEN